MNPLDEAKRQYLLAWEEYMKTYYSSQNYGLPQFYTFGWGWGTMGQ